MKKYYIQDKRSYIGNCMLWWRINGAGYTPNINEAHVFNKGEAKKICKRKSDYRMWPKEYIDSNISYHIDMQDVDYMMANN